MKSAAPPTEASTSWVVRGQQAVCVGLLVAMAALFLLTASGVSLRQTGPSPGKYAFLLAWGSTAAAVAWIPRRYRAAWGGVAFSGMLLCGAAIVSCLRVGCSAVDTALAASGLLLVGAGSRGWVWR